MASKSVALSPYSLKVLPSGYTEGEQIDSYGKPPKDLQTFFESILKNLKQKSVVDASSKKVLGLQKLYVKDRTISGILESGEYGAESNIKDINAGSVVHKKETNHADMLKFYFLLNFPLNRTKGSLLMQRIGTHGLVTPFDRFAQKSFKEQNTGYRLEIRALSTSAVFEQYLRRGDLRAIRLVRYQLPKAIEDAYPAGHKEMKGSAELVIKIRRAHGMPFADKIVSFFNGQGALNEIIELPDFKFEPDTLKFEMSVAGKRRTIGMANPGDMRGEYDVTNDVKMGTDGHPRFESIDAVARELLTDIEMVMYGSAGA